MENIKKILVSLLLMLFVTQLAIADGFPSKWCRQLKGYADEYYDAALYNMAMPIYLDLIERHPDYDGIGELNLRVGVCLLNTPDNMDECMEYLNKALGYGSLEAYLHMGQYYHRKEAFDKALDVYWKYKNQIKKENYNHEVDRLIDVTLTAKEMIANPVSVKIENMGEKINSQYPDYVPVVSADESVMIFTSRREENPDSNDPVKHFYEDVFVSYKEQGEWTKARSIGKGINSNSHDACVGISPDGNELFIYRANEFGWGDLYTSKFENGDWKEPVRMSDNINSKYWEPSASITPNNKVLFFTSNRPGGMGGRDIYMSEKMINGEWGDPVNLGPIINTQYDEDAPYIHPDGKTLYFSSKGHKNMGGFDVFRTVMDDDGNWSFPQNLGHPINTVNDDIYFVVSSDGERGYYASAMDGGIGEKDIYVVHFSGETLPITLFKGKVVAEDGEVLDATITLLDNTTKKIKGIYRSNSVTGNYLLILPPGSHTIVVEAEGYHTYSEDVIIEDEKFTEKEKDIRLTVK